MECMEARALKSSLASEYPMKSNNPQGFSDDFWCVTGLPGDDFSIDEFFDLPNEENKDGFFPEEEEEEKDSSSLSLSSQDPIDDSNSNSPIFSPDLAIPVDDVQELELWSHFMDDSVPEAALACPNPIINANNKRSGYHFINIAESERKPVHYRVPFIPSAVPVKPRTKRPRTAGNRAWVHLSSPKTEESSSSSSSPPQLSAMLFTHPVHEMSMFFGFGKPPMKKPKKKPAPVLEREAGLQASAAVQRRCSLCQVTKTPQWRAGPNGPKTLCNACGVRYKSGRLFPEYRPACSPTFSIQLHSNSHRKVLEMRRKKETDEPVGGLALPTVAIS